MPVESRVAAALAFWRDEESQDIGVQKVEVIVALARRLKFRTKSVQALGVEKRARHMAQMPEVSDQVATRALIAYHFAAKRPLMAAFLDALGIAHDNGLITEEQVAPPSVEALAAAVTKVRESFEAGEIDLYLRTLAALDSETWAGLAGLTTTAS